MNHTKSIMMENNLMKLNSNQPSKHHKILNSISLIYQQNKTLTQQNQLLFQQRNWYKHKLQQLESIINDVFQTDNDDCKKIRFKPPFIDINNIHIMSSHNQLCTTNGIKNKCKRHIKVNEQTITTKCSIGSNCKNNNRYIANYKETDFVNNTPNLKIKKHNNSDSKCTKPNQSNNNNNKHLESISSKHRNKRSYNKFKRDGKQECNKNPIKKR
eukprot:287342_1